MGSRGLREFVNLKYWIHTGGHWVGSRQACTAACVRADGSREWTRENIVPYKPRVLSLEAHLTLRTVQGSADTASCMTDPAYKSKGALILSHAYQDWSDTGAIHRINFKVLGEAKDRN
jgi:hypothetical protein